MSSRLVVVHERFTERGGSEQVVEELTALSANTRVFAPLVDRDLLVGRLSEADVTASALQRLYPGAGRYAHLLPLLPLAMRTADLSDADVVVASHHAFANRVRVPDGVPLIGYVHSPARWIWDRTKRRGEAGGRTGSAALRAFAAACRPSDQAAANRVDHLIANSRTVANRILRWWSRHAAVIHPPVDVDFHHPAPVARDDFFLVAGRLVPYKRVDVAVAAASALGCRLVVAGTGRSAAELQAMAGPTVEFVGAVDDDELRNLYRRCSALLFPGEEDFGMVPVEAQACGAPVIATAVGGATETVIDGVTGTLVEPGTDGPVEAFMAAMRGFDPADYDRGDLRANAERFSRARFQMEMHDFLAQRVGSWERPAGPGPVDISAHPDNPAMAGERR